MNIPLKITIHNVLDSEAVQADMLEQAAKLNELYDCIASCEIVVEMQHRQEKQLNVCIHLDVPNCQIVVNRGHSEDVGIALREAFDAAHLQIVCHINKLHDDCIKHGPAHAGKGSGLIMC